MFHSFRSRIILLLVGLIALVQVATVVAALVATNKNTMKYANKELQSGALIFKILFAARNAQLLDSVKILAQDFAFRRAIATADTNTIKSALTNHGARIDAQLVVLMSLDGALIASAQEVSALSKRHSYSDLIEAAHLDGAVSTVAVIEGPAYQIQIVLVSAPLPIAWLAMGFLINDPLAHELKDITGLEVSFVISSRGGAVGLVASTLAPDARPSLIDVFEDDPTPTRKNTFLTAFTGDYLTLTLPLVARADYAVTAGLQMPIAQVLSAYRELSMQLITFTLAALAVSMLAGLLMARNVTRPIAMLVDAAHKIKTGSYPKPIALPKRDELGLLAETMNDMQAGIAEREARIIYQGQHDALTGLPNRAVVKDRIDTAIAR
jgi:diguanylate cyclase